MKKHESCLVTRVRHQLRHGNFTAALRRLLTLGIGSGLEPHHRLVTIEMCKPAAPTLSPELFQARQDVL